MTRVSRHTCVHKLLLRPASVAHNQLVKRQPRACGYRFAVLRPHAKSTFIAGTKVNKNDAGGLEMLYKYVLTQVATSDGVRALDIVSDVKCRLLARHLLLSRHATVTLPAVVMCLWKASCVHRWHSTAQSAGTQLGASCNTLAAASAGSHWKPAIPAGRCRRAHPLCSEAAAGEGCAGDVDMGTRSFAHPMTGYKP